MAMSLKHHPCGTPLPFTLSKLQQNNCAVVVLLSFKAPVRAAITRLRDRHRGIDQAPLGAFSQLRPLPAARVSSSITVPLRFAVSLLPVRPSVGRHLTPAGAWRQGAGAQEQGALASLSPIITGRRRLEPGIMPPRRGLPVKAPLARLGVRMQRGNHGKKPERDAPAGRSHLAVPPSPDARPRRPWDDDASA